MKEVLGQFQHLLASRRIFCSLAKTGHAREEVNGQWSNLAFEMNYPMVVANAISFMRKEDFQAHEIRLCIDQGRVIQDTSRPSTHTKEQYFKTAVEVYQLYHDAKVVVENSNLLAKRCNVEIEMGKVFLPEVASDNIHTYFESQVREGLVARLAKFKSEKHSLEVYEARLQREINTINDMGFASYFLIVADFIKWSKGHQVPVGPGRGSGAGSLAAYALEITDIDPLEYDLLFERFLNPERVSMPDFDIDFCMVGRDKVIDYVSKNMAD